MNPGQAPVAHTSNPSYMGSCDQEDCGLRPVEQKVLETPSQPIAGLSSMHLLPQLCGSLRLEGFQFQTSPGQSPCDITSTEKKKKVHPSDSEKLK
jgi:hypothetical protein